MSLFGPIGRQPGLDRLDPDREPGDEDLEAIGLPPEAIREHGNDDERDQGQHCRLLLRAEHGRDTGDPGRCRKMLQRVPAGDLSQREDRTVEELEDPGGAVGLLSRATLG